MCLDGVPCCPCSNIFVVHTFVYHVTAYCFNASNCLPDDAAHSLLITPKPEPSHATWSPESADTTTTTQTTTHVNTDIACGIYNMAGVSLTTRFDPTVRILLLALEHQIPGTFQASICSRDVHYFLQVALPSSVSPYYELYRFSSLPTLFAV